MKEDREQSKEDMPGQGTSSEPEVAESEPQSINDEIVAWDDEGSRGWVKQPPSGGDEGGAGNPPPPGGGDEGSRGW